jgi:L-2,4-diaminobutyrate decarboxylase
MIGWVYGAALPVNGESPFNRMLKIFQELILYTSGDVQEALSWLTQLDKEYQLSTKDYSIGDFIQDLIDQGFIQQEQSAAVLQAAENKGIRVIAIVGSACSTSTGSFDDLKSLAAFAQKHQLWFHVDAAHGGALIFSKEHGQLLSGIQDADSITMDFHKMLLTPAITTALLYKDGKNAYHTFSQKAQYLWKDSDTQEWYNLAKRTFECTKTMMGFKVYAALNEFGTPLYESYINRVQDNAKNFAELINEAHDFELALEPQTNIVCFRYHPTDHQGDLCTLNVKIREKLVENGPFYLVQTELNGKKWLRVTLSNPFTSILECSDLLNQIRSIPLS